MPRKLVLPLQGSYHCLAWPWQQLALFYNRIFPSFAALETPTFMYTMSSWILSAFEARKDTDTMRRAYHGVSVEDGVSSEQAIISDKILRQSPQ